MDKNPVDIFLKLRDYDGNEVAGECLDSEFAGAIEVSEFKFSGDSAESRASGGDDDDDDGDDGDDSQPQKKTRRKKKKEKTGPLCKFEISKYLDKASTSLMQAYCWTLSSKDAVFGPKYASATFTMRKGGGSQVQFLILTFEDVSVISYDLEVKGEVPEESLTFKFEAIEMSYYPQKADGTLDVMCSAEWNFHDAAEDNGDS